MRPGLVFRIPGQLSNTGRELVVHESYAFNLFVYQIHEYCTSWIADGCNSNEGSYPRPSKVLAAPPLAR